VTKNIRTWATRAKARIVRIREIADTFGWTHTITLRTIFPPFRGWDVGCIYCAHEAGSIKAGKCARGKQHGYSKCGEIDHG
jgi:hypothetical protein